MLKFLTIDDVQRGPVPRLCSEHERLPANSGYRRYKFPGLHVLYVLAKAGDRDGALALAREALGLPPDTPVTGMIELPD